MESLKAGTLFGVEGLVAVITGGGSGIGLMIAKALDLNGAKAVYIIGRRKETLEEAAKQGANGSIIPIVGDVTSKESLTAAVARVEKEQGYINVLVANSGIIGPVSAAKLPKDRKPTIKEMREAWFEPPMEEFSQTMQVNCTATFYTCIAFLELLDAGNTKANVHGKSQIIITSSIAGFSRRLGVGMSYSVSKAGVNGLAKLLSTTLLDYDIRVNTIAPGLYPSEMTQNSAAMTSGGDPTQYGNVSRDTVPMGRVGAQEDMAGSALFLISRAGSYVNGLALVTDGGRLSMLPATY